MFSSEEKYYQSFIENLTLINSHGTGSLLSISILRIASTLIWVFKKFFNQDLKEQRRDLFKLRKFWSQRRILLLTFNKFKAIKNNVFSFSISCSAHTVAFLLSVYFLAWPCQNMKKFWYIENKKKPALQPWKGSICAIY